MKKYILVIGVLVFGLTILAQEIQHETITINIEVPVRVFTKGKFAGELTIKDFELYEDGISQEILALYLVKKTMIEREETESDERQASKIFIPETSRTFVLMFEMVDYFPKTREVLDYLFESVISPGDSLFIITPSNNYSFKEELSSEAPREVIVDQLIEKVRKDIRSESREYRGMYFDEGKLIEFKDKLKDIEGQKYVFLFYQQLLIPLHRGISYIGEQLISFDIKKIKQIFSDSSIFINFIFLTKAQIHQLDVTRKSRTNKKLIDISSAIFGAFYEMAKATGGITDTSANIASSFQRASISSENYYLLYYTPKNYQTDGKFKNIKVKVKGKNYRITHRAGYLAD
jgi:VWFA-related protein